MDPVAEELIRAVRALHDGDRWWLIDALDDHEFVTYEPVVTDELLQELQRRSDAYDADPSTAISWEELSRKMQLRFEEKCDTPRVERVVLRDPKADELLASIRKLPRKVQGDVVFELMHDLDDLPFDNRVLPLLRYVSVLEPTEAMQVCTFAEWLASLPPVPDTGLTIEVFPRRK